MIKSIKVVLLTLVSMAFVATAYADFTLYKRKLNLIYKGKIYD